MRPVRSVLLFLLLCVFLLILAAPAGAAPAAGGTLMYQMPYVPGGIVPQRVSDDAGLRVTDALFDSLTRWDPLTSAVLPAAALSWTVSPDAKVWTFHLDPAAKFSNGTAVTAKAFKASWEWSVWHWAPYSYVLSDVKGFNRVASRRTAHLSGVVAADAATLVVTLRIANADFGCIAGHPVLGPVPPARISTAARAKAFAANPVGNGPFKLAQAWNHLATIKLVASSGTTYTGVKPNIAGITFKTVADPAVAYARLQAGKLDVAAFPYSQSATVIAAYGRSDNGLTAQPAKQVVAGPVDVTRLLFVNNGRAPFDDVRVRQAASLAIDRAKLTSPGTWPGMSGTGPASVADDFLSPYIPGYMPGAWIYSILNVSQAQTLLADAGHAGGAGLAPVILPFWPGMGALATEVKAELSAVGFTVKTVRVTTMDRLGTGKWSMWTFGWGADYPAAEDYLYTLSSKSFNDIGGYSGADAAIDAARATVDDTARLAAWKAVDATIGADTPLIPIGYWGRCVVCSARLNDATLSAMNLFDFTSVWITP